MFTKEYFQEIQEGFQRQMMLLDEKIVALSVKAEAALAASCAGSIADCDTAADAIAAKMRTLLINKKEEILNTIENASTDEAEALTFLYSAMPLSDLLDYPASLFLTYAKHGAWLYAHGPFAGKVPERLFANYVLHHRINNEDIVDNRSFFYEQLQKTMELPAKSMYDAAVETNYWCAAQATYRASDGRTENPLTMYNSGTGRCGEESTFGVSALRSIGIPARQVYAPLWSHCDDNHAWVEVWCASGDAVETPPRIRSADIPPEGRGCPPARAGRVTHFENASRLGDAAGQWYFLGACEPEERLNFGWFTGPASRAMLLHSRWFGQDEPLDPIVSKKGMARVLNHLARYAYTTELTVKVQDRGGNPIPGAKVQFYVLNHGNYGLVAELETTSSTTVKEEGANTTSSSATVKIKGTEEDTTAACSAVKTSPGSNAITDGTDRNYAADCGIVHLTTGYGDLYVTASKDGSFGDCHISLINTDSKEASCTITLQEAPLCSATWQDVDFHAPSLGFLHDETLTDEQKATSAARLAEATAMREARLNATWQEDPVAHVLAHFSEPDAKELTEILHKAKGNLPELLKFLEWDASALVPADWEPGRQEHWKLLLLQSLREKDFKDTTADILIDCCENALPYAGTIEAPLDGTLPTIGFRFGPGPQMTSGNAEGTKPVAPSDEIFFRLLANPRVENEMLRPCRHMLTEFFREEADALKKEPQKLPAFIKSLIISMPGEEYERLVTSPAGCLCGGIASELSIDVLCVTMYRCLGIPARLNMLDHSLQYYQNGKFITVLDTEKTPKTPDTAAGSEKTAALAVDSQADATPANAILRLVGDDSLNLSNWEHYSVSRYQNGEFSRLFLFGAPIDVEKNEQTIEVKPGIYRVLTTNRMLNGNQLARVITFSLKAGEERTVSLSLRTPSLAENLVNRPVEDLYFGTLDSAEGLNITPDKVTAALDATDMTSCILHTPIFSGKRISLTQLIEGNSGKALFLWLEVGREPTEHILNELYDRKDAYAALKSPLYVILNKPEDLSDPTLQRTLRALPCLTPILGLSKNDLHTLAREVRQEADSLPLTVVMKEGNTCIYSNCGYNVGITDLLLQILRG